MPPKVKLTPEEKKLLAIQKKEEKKRKAIAKKRQLKHDYVSREVKYGDLTIKRHEKDWRQMLITIALPRVREDLQFAWNNFERAIDARDFTISILMDEFKYSEEQYMRNFRAHCDNIDKLLLQFRDTLNEMHRDYQNALNKMETSGEDEMNSIQAWNQNQEEYIKTMIYCLDQDRKRLRNVIQTDYLSRVDEERTKYADTLQSKRAVLENTVSNLWDSTIDYLNEYHNRTNERYKEYAILNQNDEQMQRMLSGHIRKLQYNSELLKRLKQKMADLEKARGHDIGDLRHERDYFGDAFRVLKNRLKYDRGVDAKKLAQLTQESNDVIKHLKRIFKKGDQLLSLTSICGKFESEAEKVLAFPHPGPLLDMRSESMVETDPILRTTAKLKYFWQHVAQSDAIRCSMNEERNLLKRENFEMKRKIHAYCACVDCPGVLNVIERQSSTISVTDGYFFMKKYEKYPDWHF